MLTEMENVHLWSWLLKISAYYDIEGMKSISICTFQDLVSVNSTCILFYEQNAVVFTGFGHL